jgi:hypothetical protein
MKSALVLKFFLVIASRRSDLDALSINYLLFIITWHLKPSGMGRGVINSLPSGDLNQGKYLIAVWEASIQSSYLAILVPPTF